MTDPRDPLGPDGPPDDAVLAAEYALGLMDARSRATFEDRLSMEPGLAREVTRWQQDFSGMALELEPVMPPADALPRLEAALFGSAPARVAAAASAPRPVADAGRALRRFWQGLGLGAATAAGALAVLVLGVPGAFGPVLTLPGGAVEQAPGTGAQVFAAQLAGDAGLRVLAVFEPDAGVLRLARTEGAAAQGRALELWVIAGQAAPVSLGVLPADAVARIAVPQELFAAVSGGLLAISDEPPGGSPTGAPTGAVLAAGPVTSL